MRIIAGTKQVTVSSDPYSVPSIVGDILLQTDGGVNISWGHEDVWHTYSTAILTPILLPRGFKIKAILGNVKVTYTVIDNENS
jgi:hypothetical protein